MVIDPFQAFVDSSCGGVVERHVQCACILLNLPLRLTAVGCTLQ